jgi:GT2 family glycosyltransferase
MARTAIIVVTFNSERYLDDLFASLAEHTDLSTARIVVVDNGSVDGTRASLERHATRLPLDLLLQSSNLGFAGGNNVGLARARSLGAEYALLLNADTVVTPGWLSTMTAVMDQRTDAAAAQPLLVLHDRPDLINSAGNALHFCGFGFCADLGKPAAPVASDGRTRPVPYASGAALLLRMTALEQVGDLDPLLFLYHEECDLQIRLRQAGWECVLVPTACVRHKYEASFTPAKYRWLERNRWMVLIKNWPADALLAAAPALAGVQLAVIAFAARTGWLPEMLSAHLDVLRHLPELLAARAEAQAAWSARGNLLEHLSAELIYDGLAHPLIRRLGNPILAAWWRGARRLLPSVRRARAARRDASTALSRGAGSPILGG